MRIEEIDNGRERKKLKTELDDNGVKEEQDRLSSLVEPIIIDILSLLPIDNAAVTSTLSRRWRNLWTQITSIRIDFSNPDKPILSETIHHILNQLNSSKIYHLNLRLYDGQVSIPVLDSLYDHIRTRKVETIEMSGLDDYHEVPSWVFECQSLVSLVYDWTIEAELPINGVNLPCLKKLQITLTDNCPDLLRNLFRSCPKLEDLELALTFYDEDPIVNIASPNLKYLDIECESDGKFVIDAPMLVSFHFSGCASSCYFVQNSTRLDRAHISPFRFPCNENNYAKMVLQVFPAMANVRYLWLSYPTQVFSNICSMDEKDMPIFHNLNHLVARFGNRNHCWKEFIMSQRCFPNLEVLSLSFHPNDWDEDCECPVVSPIWSKLRNVSISWLLMNQYAVQLLKHILINSSILEIVHIWVTGDDVKIWNEKEFCKTIFELPRSSSKCEIKFTGFHIHASSTSFEGNELGCQIRFNRFPGFDVQAPR